MTYKLCQHCVDMPCGPGVEAKLQMPYCLPGLLAASPNPGSGFLKFHGQVHQHFLLVV